MKKIIAVVIAAAVLALIVLGYINTASHSVHHGSEAKLDPKKEIFSHLCDNYGWEVPFDHGTRMPLPIIVQGEDGAWHCFSSARLMPEGEYEGFTIASDGDYAGKVVQLRSDGSQYRPVDLSITKNAAALLISALVVILLVMALKRHYKRNGMKAPRKATGLLELIFEFVYTDTIVPIMGREAKKYGPYLMTAFFFILTMNLLGLIVIFPGGANLTGNLAVTGVLALATFLITNLTGTRHYWKEILWPEVPTALKCPVPMMQLIEFIGMLTKPLALMVRLFANMLGGHMVVIVLILLIFIFTNSFGSAAVGGGTAVVSVLLALFMLALDTLVSFIQAYVFTLLSTIFISMAHEGKHEPAEAKNE